MIILITGPTHTGKTLLASRFIDRYKYACLSIDHLKMGLIRSGNTPLTPEDDDALTEYLWPIVRELIKTAIENRQNLIVEGCYVPFDWRQDFDAQYLRHICFICLALTDAYIDAHFDAIRAHASDIEARLDDGGYTAETLKADNRAYIEGFGQRGEQLTLIDDDYEAAIGALLARPLRAVTGLGSGASEGAVDSVANSGADGEIDSGADGGTARKQLFTEIPYLTDARLTIRRLTAADAPGLKALATDPEVYRYLPTFLFEQKYADVDTVLERLYTEGFRESIIMGIFAEGRFAGLIELYGYRAPIRKISVGYRLLRQFWGQGIATEAVGLLIRYLYEETDVEIVTASTMVENRASANVLKKNGFSLVAEAVPEDWGFADPVPADKWIR